MTLPEQPLPEHPAIEFNRWFETAASGEPFFPGLYTSDQLRAVAYLAWVAGRESLDEIRDALAQSVQLQAHYAELLNMHDGGHRIIFPTVEAWLERLRRVEELKQRVPRP